MINKVILVGNLGRDPEVKTSQGGGSVCRLSVATTERQKDRDGNWEDHTEWHTVVCFGNTADNVGRFLKKGRQVYVEGKLRTNKWKDKDGNDRYTTEVVAFDVKFLGGGGQGEGGNDRQRDDSDRGNRRSEPDRGRDASKGSSGRAGGGSASSQGGGSYGGGASSGSYNTDDDIPFSYNTGDDAPF